MRGIPSSREIKSKKSASKSLVARLVDRFEQTSCSSLAHMKDNDITSGTQHYLLTQASIRTPCPLRGATTSLIAACNSMRTAGTPLSPTSLKMSGLDANCNRTTGYSIFDLPSVFERVTDANGAASANVTGSLNTDDSVDGGLVKLDLHLGAKNTINGKYYIGTHRGLVVNSQTITQPYWRPTDDAWVHFSGAQWDYAKSSSVVNTLRFGFNHFYQKFETSDCEGSGNGQPDYGIPFGYGSTKPVCGFTNITLTGFSGSIGCCSSFPKYYGPDNIF